MALQGHCGHNVCYNGLVITAIVLSLVQLVCHGKEAL